MQAPEDFFTTLPSTLPAQQPYYYLSIQQQNICRTNPILAPYANHLPCWIPHRKIADAFGFSHTGIENALARLNGKPYVWGTEFENVHATWNFDEPSFIVNGVTYRDSESFYQRQKPVPFNPQYWDTKRDDIMRIAIQKKFNQCDKLKGLLLETHPHPMLSIKGDRYWGVGTDGIGSNRLAALLMQLRTQLLVI